MIDGNQNAYAIGTNYPGLNKRELFAAMAMQGFISADKKISLDEQDIAEYSVNQADALIAALNMVLVE